MKDYEWYSKLNENEWNWWRELAAWCYKSFPGMCLPRPYNYIKEPGHAALYKGRKLLAEAFYEEME